MNAQAGAGRPGADPPGADPLGADVAAAPAVAVAVAAPDGGLAGWSSGAQDLLGYPATEVVGRPATALLAGALPASARERVAAQQEWAGRVALRHRDGRPVECVLRARPLRGADPRPGWLFEAEPLPPGSPSEEDGPTDDTLLRWAFDQSPFALAIYDTEGRFLRINEPMARQLDAAEHEVRGLRITEHMPDPAFQLPERYVDRVAATGEPEHVENFVRVPGEPSPHAWIVHFAPLKDPAGTVHGVQLAALDFSEQAAARERLALLDQASRSIGSSLDVVRTAQELADVAVPVCGDFVSVDLLEPVLRGEEPAPILDEAHLLLRRAAVCATVRPAVELGRTARYPESSPVARCLATGQGVVHRITDPEVVQWLAEDPDRAAWVREYRPHSILAVPLRARGTNLGVVLCARLAPHTAPYGPDDLRIAEELATRAAVCIDNARRYTGERSTALALQHSLLPQELSEQVAVEVAGRYLPADSRAGVGGDWYDVIPLSGARVALVAGDVVGHGIHASAAMGRLRTAVRTLADVDLAPDELLAHLDDLVIRLGTGHAADLQTPTADLGATCLYAVYDPVSRICSLASAGHPHPAVVTPDGAVDLLRLPTGPPLGLGGLPFESVDRRLPEGSLLVLYTNGLIESRHRDVDLGLDALLTALGGAEPSLESTCDRVMGAMLAEHNPDDVALLIARTRALGAEHVAEWDVPSDPAVVAEARARATAQLHAWDLDALSFVTELVVSELVTNAIRYADPPVRLRLIKEQTLVCEVSDASSTAPHLRRARTYDEGGRGLMLVAQLTDRWGTRHTATGKTIWAEQPLPGTTGGRALG